MFHQAAEQVFVLSTSINGSLCNHYDPIKLMRAVAALGAKLI